MSKMSLQSPAKAKVVGSLSRSSCPVHGFPRSPHMWMQTMCTWQKITNCTRSMGACTSRIMPWSVASTTRMELLLAVLSNAEDKLYKDTNHRRSYVQMSTHREKPENSLKKWTKGTRNAIVMTVVTAIQTPPEVLGWVLSEETVICVKTFNLTQSWIFTLPPIQIKLPLMWIFYKIQHY